MPNDNFKNKMSPEQYHVMREGGTEPAFTGKYWDEHAKGMYNCAACGAVLFSSDAKFDSGTGWPSFTEPANLEHVELRDDNNSGMHRTEVICKNCGSHLGHVFDDGPADKGGKRYCINSVCLELEEGDNSTGIKNNPMAHGADVKPEFFYHGSPHRDLGMLEPRSEKVRDGDEGPVVFASPELVYAIMFMAPHAESGAFGDVPYLAIIADRDEFVKNDRGGHVYVVPGDTFENDPAKGLGIYEWTSKVPVKPLRVIEYPSVLDAAIENSIQIYFIDQATHEVIRESSDDGLAVYRSLRSENQRRGVNIKKL